MPCARLLKHSDEQIPGLDGAVRFAWHCSNVNICRVHCQVWPLVQGSLTVQGRRILMWGRRAICITATKVLEITADKKRRR
jgi:hypothetical protein